MTIIDQAHVRSRACLLFVLATACGGGGSNPTVDVEGTIVSLGPNVAVAPEAWNARQPRNTMRLAEFTLPASAGAADTAEVVVFFFGSGQGGDVAANMERWSAQFTDADGNHPEPTTETLDDVAFPTTIVQYEGSYNRGIGMGGAPAEAKPDQVLVAAVIEAPGGNLYAQMYGPRETVLAQRDAFLGFVRSVRPHPAEG